MLKPSKRFWRDQSGQDLSEYALLLALIAVALVIILVALGDQIISAFSRVTNTLQNGNSQAST